MRREENLTRHTPTPSQTPNQRRHEHFVCHRIYDAADYGLLFPFPRDPAVYQVGYAGVCEEEEGWCRLVGYN